MIIIFLIRNLPEGEKEGRWCIQNAERKKKKKNLPTPAKLLFKNEGDKDIPRQTNTEAVYHH